jgi:hypothetical protein
VPRERRPADHEYYEERLQFLSQGDIFDDVPLSYPLPAREIATDEGTGERKFLSGPLEFGKAMLITPTCSMRAQGVEGYAHPVRTLVPVVPVDEGLVSHLGLNEEKLGFLRSYDGLINYMYLPASDSLNLRESLALLYMPITLHHDIIDGQRITQLAVEGARQLHQKLVWFVSGWHAETRAMFDPPMD